MVENQEGTPVAQLALLVNGAPVTDASVTLSGSFGSVALPYLFNGYFPNETSVNYAVYLAQGGFPYHAGQTYVISAVTSAGLSSVTITAPGGNVSVSPNGQTATWDHAGNQDEVTVYNSLNQVFDSADTTADALSPFNIPASVFGPQDTYEVDVDVILTSNQVSNAVLDPANPPQGEDFETFSFCEFAGFPCGTVVPTSTPTVTPSPTPTPVIVFDQAQVFYNGSSSTPQGAELYLQVNGAPQSTAAVTLFGPGLGSGIPLAYAFPVTDNSEVFSAYGTAAFTYQGGQTYALYCHTTAGNASVTVTAPGPTTVSSNGLTVSWGQGGDFMTLSILDGVTSVYSKPLTTSPQQVPVSVYAAAGSYKANINLQSYSTPVNAVMSDNGFSAMGSYQSITSLCIGGGDIPCPKTYQASWGTAGAGKGQFGRPQGIAFDASGNLWVADLDNNRIQELPAGLDGSVAGNWVTDGGPASSGVAGQFSDPQGLVVDSSGNLYVADTFNSRIQKLPVGLSPATSSNWATVGISGTAAGQFNNPTQVGLDASGNLWVADYSNNRLQRLLSANFTNSSGWAAAGGTAAGTAPGSFSNPKGLFFDGSSNLWVADSGNNRIEELPWPDSYSVSGNWTTIGGTASGTTPGKFNAPQEVTVDSQGNLFVSDSGNNRIQELGAGLAANVSTNWVTIGGPGSGAGQFSTPVGVAVDASGKLYVADSNNDRIEVFGP